MWVLSYRDPPREGGTALEPRRRRGGSVREHDDAGAPVPMNKAGFPSVDRDVHRVAGLLHEHDGLDLDTLVLLLQSDGWSDQRAFEAVRAASMFGHVYEDCRHDLHAG
jgi:hypothetical protein